MFSENTPSFALLDGLKPPYSALKILFCPIKSNNFASFPADFQLIPAAIKKTSKNLHIPLADNEKPSTFAPAFRKGAGS